MEAHQIDLAPHTEGTTWEGISSIGPITFSDGLGDPFTPPNPIDDAWCQFRRGGPDGPVALSFSTAGDPHIPITLVSAANWELSIPPVSYDKIPLKHGPYHWSLKIKDSAGTIYPIYEGVLTVLQSATNTNDFIADE